MHEGHAITDGFIPASPQLHELHQEAEALGYQPSMDFAVKGIPGSLSSELIILTQEDDSYVVYYRDMGRSREVARSTDLGVIRTHFFDQLADLAGPRGRGPWAGRKRPSPYEGMSTEERIEASRKLGWFPTPEEVRARDQALVDEGGSGIPTKKRWSLHFGDPSSSSDVSALRQELIGLGFEEGVDFAIAGWPTPVSSELYVLSHEAGVFVVEYREMGRTREIARASSFDKIRPHFLGKIEDLAGPRGRGPSAGLPNTFVPKNWSLEEKIAEARRLGLDLG